MGMETENAKPRGLAPNPGVAGALPAISPSAMSQPPLFIRLLRRLSLSPQKSLLCLCDITALLGTAILIFLLRAAFGGVDPVLYHWVLPLLLLGPLLGASLGLYQSISLPPQRELKAFFLLTSLIYGLILAVLFLAKAGDAYSRLVIAGSWAASIFTLPIMRSWCRRRFGKCSWWGRALIILDRSNTGRDLWRYLKRHPERGLTPVAIFSLPDEPHGVRQLMVSAAARYPAAIALILQKVEQGQTMDYITEAVRYFSRVLVVPSFGKDFRTHWLTPRDLGNVVGLLVRQNLRDKRRLRLKRGIDLFLCLLGAAMLLPLGLCLALAIRWDSPGPVFYRQRRIGQGGKEVRIFKFRTMAVDADEALQAWLERDPDLRSEWERNRKLKHDPRITRMGAFLRKTSLDELPQLFNVLWGDMSLVGPRPIVAEEVRRYGPVYEEYCLVKPGITGLWQISGRNNTSYEERVAFDHYYINNWSVWMDLWILGKTVPVVLSGYGAY